MGVGMTRFARMLAASKLDRQLYERHREWCDELDVRMSLYPRAQRLVNPSATAGDVVLLSLTGPDAENVSGPRGNSR